MPWAPELFSTPVLEQVLERHGREHRQVIRFFDGIATGEVDALVESFSGVPEVHHPIRGRIRGEGAFRRFAADMTTWLATHVSVEHVGLALTDPRGVEEAVLDIARDGGRVRLPVAIAADHDADARIVELRMYFSSWPLTGTHANRPPLLQPDPDLRAPDVVGRYLDALDAGDAEAALAAFASDGVLHGPAGEPHVHRGPDALRALYGRFLADGGVPLERCAITDDGRACALEYNLVRWGATAVTPTAGLAVHVRDDDGRLAAVRMYGDVAPPA